MMQKMIAILGGLAVAFVPLLLFWIFRSKPTPEISKPVETKAFDNLEQAKLAIQVQAEQAKRLIREQYVNKHGKHPSEEDIAKAFKDAGLS